MRQSKNRDSHRRTPEPEPHNATCRRDGWDSGSESDGQRERQLQHLSSTCIAVTPPWPSTGTKPESDSGECRAPGGGRLTPHVAHERDRRRLTSPRLLTQLGLGGAGAAQAVSTTDEPGERCAAAEHGKAKGRCVPRQQCRRRRAWASRRDLVPNDGLGLRPSLVISGLRSTICHGGLGMAAHRRMQGARPDGGRHRGKIDGIPCVTRIHGGFWGQDLPALLNMATGCCRTDDEVAITVGRGGYFDRFLRGCLAGLRGDD